MSWRKASRAVLAIATAALAAHSNAATIVCTGTVDQLVYYNPGMIMVRLSSMNTAVFVCSTEATFTAPNAGYSTSPQACKVMYAGLLTAKTANTPIAAMYFDAASVPSSCGSWPEWANAQVRLYVH